LLIQWIAEVMGYPKEAVGNLTSGGSIANLIGIVCALRPEKGLDTLMQAFRKVKAARPAPE
jgi:glutamate/tyrosine decarboxylase-like PLP-dependent enzyme